MNLEGKSILIISPEPWGTNRVSKHHYALALSKRNNQVFFLNPPLKRSDTPQLKIIRDGGTELQEISYSPCIAGTNRLPSIVRDFIQLIDIKKILKLLPQRPDIIWSFDPYRFQNLTSFGASLSIFHPVDYFNTPLEFDIAHHADLILSVSDIILKKFNSPNNSFFINHGLSDYFINEYPKNKTDRTLRCGYLGNLRSFGLDHTILARIVMENPNVEFHFIGPLVDSNLGTSSTSNENLNQVLKESRNIFFHGELPPEKVAKLIQTFDLFLLCYLESISKIASNSHKILEYLSTGKVIVSSYVSTYDSMPNGLFEMSKRTDDLPSLFKKVLLNLSDYNSEDLQEMRRDFAKENSYEKQIQRIENIITGLNDQLKRSGHAGAD